MKQGSRVGPHEDNEFYKPGRGGGEVLAIITLLFFLPSHPSPCNTFQRTNLVHDYSSSFESNSPPDFFNTLV